MKPKTQIAIHAHALEDYPREACGVIVVRKGRERYIRCRNLAATPDEHFVMSPADFAEAEDQGEVTAIVHSHPNVPARPSEADRVGCEQSELPWVIVSVMPVSAWISGGIGTSGSTSEHHSVIRGDAASALSTRTMPISVIRSAAARVPVVSRSTNANADGSMANSAVGSGGRAGVPALDNPNVRSLF